LALFKKCFGSINTADRGKHISILTKNPFMGRMLLDQKNTLKY